MRDSFSFKSIKNCYDSHVHWQATGEKEFRLDLSNLKSAEDVAGLQISDKHYRNEWLVGFGWDHHKWENSELPSKEVLDRVFGNKPVLFIRADGHAAWANTEALKRSGMHYRNPQVPEGSKVPLDAEGFPQGVVFENAAEALRRILPPLDSQQIKLRLEAGAKIFNQAGFTHIRDLSGNLQQWQASCELEDAGQLNLHVDQFFGVEAEKSFHQVLREALYAAKERRNHLKACGVKVYLDGSLGSETAFLSQDYKSGSGHGLCLLERFTLKEIFIETWSAGLDLAVHAIGDEALHMLAGVANELWGRGEDGILHVEHGQMCRPETLPLLLPKKTRIHMQPCHWWTDKLWLNKKLTPELFRTVFPWRLYESAGIPVLFGSDSPIEPAIIQNNYSAVLDAAENGVPIFANEFWRFQTHPDRQLSLQGLTEFEQGKVVRVRLDDKIVYQAH